MQTLRFIYKDVNNNLCVTRIMLNHIEYCQKLGHCDDKIKQDIINKDILPYCPSGIYHEVLDTDIPIDRYFRNAWDHTIDGNLFVNAELAQNIHMNNLRTLRAPKLKQLDIDYLKASEKNDDTIKILIATQKQKLRDMPQNEDLSQISIDDLQNYIPEYLK